jgi:cytidylate kinase
MNLDCILLCGHSGAGKSSAALHLSSRFNLPIVDTGAVLANYLAASGERVRSRTEIGARFLQRFNAEDVFEVLATHRVCGRTTIYDGVRLAVTCRQFRMTGLGVSIWYIDASSQMRHCRASTHDGGDDAVLVNDAMYEYELLQIRRFANHVVPNEDGYGNFMLRIESLYLNEERLSRVPKR